MINLKDIIKKIKLYNTIIIHGHQHPDGDCLGSQIGLKEIIKTTYPNKEVYIVGEDSDYLSFLGETDKISDDKYKGALAIIVDLANEDRISDDRHKFADYTIRIDHHVKVDEFTNMEYIDTDAPACAEIIFRLVSKYKMKISYFGARALYTGIVTDTGRFKYDSIKPATMRAAAELLEYGVNPAEIDENLSVDTPETLKLKGYVLSNFKVTEEGLAYIKMTRDVIEKFKVTDEQAANMVNLLSTLKEVLVWALFIEYADHKLKIRIRSKGPVVNEFAKKYNGGGHPKASGASMETWDDADRFIKDMDEYLKEYKREN